MSRLSHFLQQSFLSPVLHGHGQSLSHLHPWPHACDVHVQSREMNKINNGKFLSAIAIHFTSIKKTNYVFSSKLICLKSSAGFFFISKYCTHFVGI